MIKRNSSQDELAWTCIHLRINTKGKISNIKVTVGVLIKLTEKLIGTEDKSKYIEDTNNVTLAQ